MDRPANCPDRTCTCIHHSDDEDMRLCWGRMPDKKLDQKYNLYNTHRHCEDGEEVDQFNSADALYTIEGNLAALRDVLANSEIYNPLPDLGVDNPLGILERRLKGE